MDRSVLRRPTPGSVLPAIPGAGAIAVLIAGADCGVCVGRGPSGGVATVALCRNSVYSCPASPDLIRPTCSNTWPAWLQRRKKPGFDSVWVMDHFFQLPPLGGPDQPMLEAYTLLGALAARTRRVQLGTLVTGVTYRNPGILAKIITTLDVISLGRAILGIGGAWYDVEHQGLGIDYPGDRVRLDMLEEAVQVCRHVHRRRCELLR